jgi:hypothetical protein
MSSGPQILTSSFIHIPKTGGSSLRWLLDRQYRSFLYVIPQWFDIGYADPKTALKQLSQSVDMVGAHRPLDQAWPEGASIAMVRDPVKRVLSHVAHLRAEPGVWLPSVCAEAELAIADWIERRPLALFDNNQVRYLSGASEFDGMPMSDAMGEQDLEKALEVARTRVLVAPMEAFDEALLDWGHRLNWGVPYYRRVNVRRQKKPGLPERDLQALEAWNRLDRILCEEVGVLFRQRLAELEERTGQSMDEQLAIFRRKNESYAAKSRILWHTLARGFKHPLRASQMILRTANQRFHSAGRLS